MHLDETWAVAVDFEREYGELLWLAIVLLGREGRAQQDIEERDEAGRRPMEFLHEHTPVRHFYLVEKQHFCNVLAPGIDWFFQDLVWVSAGGYFCPWSFGAPCSLLSPNRRSRYAGLNIHGGSPWPQSEARERGTERLGLAGRARLPLVLVLLAFAFCL